MNNELTNKIQLHKLNMNTRMSKVIKTDAAARSLLYSFSLPSWAKSQAISIIITGLVPELRNRILYDTENNKDVGITFYNELFWFIHSDTDFKPNVSYLVSFRTFAIPERIYNKLPRNQQVIGRKRGDGNYQFNIACIAPTKERI